MGSDYHRVGRGHLFGEVLYLGLHLTTDLDRECGTRFGFGDVDRHLLIGRYTDRRGEQVLSVRVVLLEPRRFLSNDFSGWTRLDGRVRSTASGAGDRHEGDEKGVNDGT